MIFDIVIRVKTDAQKKIPDIPMGPDWRWYHRQNELRDNWNFECACALCSASQRQRRASDERRARFADLAHEFHQLVDDNHHDKALAVLEQAIRINAAEPMLTSATPLLLRAAWTAYHGGQGARARGYVDKVEEDMRARGFEDEGDRESLENIKGLLN
jgi:hypothetical protein